MGRDKILIFLVGGMVVILIAFTQAISGGVRPRTAQSAPAEHTDPRPVGDASGLGSRSSAAAGDAIPLMIRWSNWQPEFGPSLVYARERDLDGMLRMSGPVDKMLMVTSYAETERLMRRAQELQEAGVIIVGLNTENGLTPASEMNTLNDPDPQRNVVGRVAELVTSNGFGMLWGPVRGMTDSVGDDVIRMMMAAGVRGLAIQEQKFIQVQPASIRLDAVRRTRDRYQGLAAAMGVTDFTYHVQIMHERCPDLDNCVAFVAGLEEIPVDSIAIWSNGPIPASFVRAIRRQ